MQASAIKSLRASADQVPHGLCQVCDVAAMLNARPGAALVFDVQAIGAGVLADDQQFLDAAHNQALCFLHHICNVAAYQVTPQ